MGLRLFSATCKLSAPQLSAESLGTRRKDTMKTKFITVVKIIPMLFISISSVYSQDAEDMRAYALADSLIKIAFGPTYNAGGVLDIDHILRMPKEKSQWEGYIFEDPNNQLQHCIIFCFGKWDSMDAKVRYGSGVTLNDSGGVGIIRKGKIVWYSNRFILAYTEVGGRISGFADLNNDGTTDIICSMCERYSETLWLISPIHKGGKLLNAVDREGYSLIKGGESSFEFFDSGRNKIKEIHALRPESENLERLTYILQGSVFSELKSTKNNSR